MARTLLTYDPHKKYKRASECRRCGRCCDLHCQYLRWVANWDVPKGQVFSDTGEGHPFEAICLANPKPEMCANFPTSPVQTPEKCGFRWILEEEANG